MTQLLNAIQSYTNAIAFVQVQCLSCSNLCYETSDINFCKTVDNHFAKSNHRQAYGIYTIKQRQSGNVLYIGKAGSIRNNGSFREQGLQRRFKNRKTNDVHADIWFRELSEEYGCLQIDYFVLDKSVSPALCEAILLQGYLNENGELPKMNRSF